MRGAAGIVCFGGHDQRLELDQERTVAIEHRHDRRTRRPDLAIGEKHAAGIGNRFETASGHVEDAGFARGPEPMLGRAQEAESLVAVALERQHGVDKVFERVRGPANVPSLVTWPTKIVGIARSFAASMSSCVHSRTWVTEPGTEGNDGVDTVWIESTKSRSGPRRATSPAPSTPRFRLDKHIV